MDDRREEGAAEALLERAAAFFQHERFERAGTAILRKRPWLARLLSIVAILAPFRWGNMLLIAMAIIAFRGLRAPLGGPIFQYGLSVNNLRVLHRINKAAHREEWDDRINGRPFSTKERLAILVRFGALAAAGAALARRYRGSVFSQVQLALTLAAYLAYRRHSFEGINCVCVASDHSPISLGLLHVARQKGIRTCYAQHAPVAHYFPPLDYDLAILFDRVSIELYDHPRGEDPPCRGKVVILPPFTRDFERLALPGGSCSRVGICLSYVFDEDGVRQLISQLLNLEHVETIRLRRHPRCRASVFDQLAEPRVVETFGETLEVFAEQCDVVIVPNSGVTVELLHLGVPVVYAAQMDKLHDDYYGFLKRRIVPPFRSELLRTPNSLADFYDEAWRDRFSIYDETINRSLLSLREEAGRCLREVVGDLKSVSPPSEAWHRS